MTPPTAAPTPSPAPTSTRRRSARRLPVAALCLAVLLGLLSATAEPAGAWTQASPSGRPGNVTLPTVDVLDVYDSAIRDTAFSFSSPTGPIAWRSPASTGVQTVKSRQAVQQWNGSTWVNVASTGLLTGQIGSSQSGVQFGRMYLRPMTARGYFRATWAFDWYDSSGRLIGSALVISNQTTDHRCVTNVRLCVAYAGYVRTGGYRTGAW